jgi:hypothetical protein
VKLPKYDAPRPGEPMHEWKLNKNVAEYMYESDIVLLPSQLDQLITNGRPKRKATNDPQAKWPTSAQGIIPYSFDSSIGKSNDTHCLNLLVLHSFQNGLFQLRLRR